MNPSAQLVTNLPLTMATRLLSLLFLLIPLAFSTGCAQFGGAARHGWEGPEYEHTYLSTSSPLGQKALNNWRDFDIDVRQFLRRHRDPDVIYSEQMAVTFFYLKEKTQVNFDRPAVGFYTKVDESPIPEALYQELQQRFD